MAFSNGYLKSANDDSYGFFRRQLILMTKPRPKDRIDDPFLSEKLRAEREPDRHVGAQTGSTG